MRTLIFILLLHSSFWCKASEIGIWITPNDCISCCDFNYVVKTLESSSLDFNIYMSDDFIDDSSHYKKMFESIFSNKIQFVKERANFSFYKNCVFIRAKDSIVLAKSLRTISDNDLFDIIDRIERETINSDDFKKSLSSLKFSKGSILDMRYPLCPVTFNKSIGELKSSNFVNGSFKPFKLVFNLDSIKNVSRRSFYPLSYKKVIKNEAVVEDEGKANYLQSSVVSYFQESSRKIYAIVELNYPIKKVGKIQVLSKYVLVSKESEDLKILRVKNYTSLLGYSINPFSGFYVNENRLYSNAFPFLANEKKGYFILNYKIRNRVKAGKIVKNFGHPKYFTEKGLNYNDNAGLWDDGNFVFKLDPTLFNVSKRDTVDNSSISNPPISNQEVISYYGRHKEYRKTRNFYLLSNCTSKGEGMVYTRLGALYYGRISQNGNLKETLLRKSFDSTVLGVTQIDNSFIVIYSYDGVIIKVLDIQTKK